MYNFLIEKLWYVKIIFNMKGDDFRINYYVYNCFCVLLILFYFGSGDFIIGYF